MRKIFLLFPLGLVICLACSDILPPDTPNGKTRESLCDQAARQLAEAGTDMARQEQIVGEFITRIDAFNARANVGQAIEGALVQDAEIDRIIQASGENPLLRHERIAEFLETKFTDPSMRLLAAHLRLGVARQASWDTASQNYEQIIARLENGARVWFWPQNKQDAALRMLALKAALAWLRLCLESEDIFGADDVMRTASAHGLGDDLEKRLGDDSDMESRRAAAGMLIVRIQDEDGVGGNAKKAFALLAEFERRFGAEQDIYFRRWHLLGLVSKARILRQQGQIAESNALFEQLEAKFGSLPDASMHVTLGKALSEQGDVLLADYPDDYPEKALEAFERQAEHFRKAAEADEAFYVPNANNIGRATALLRLERDKEAIPYLRRALKIMKSEYNGFNDCAEAFLTFLLWLVGDEQTSLRTLRDAISNAEWEERHPPFVRNTLDIIRPARIIASLSPPSRRAKAECLLAFFEQAPDPARVQACLRE